jgi:hypothetical protein
MIKPINGLETANPSEIASLNGSKSRLRMRGRAFATGKSVARPAPKALGVSAATSRTLIVFMTQVIGDDPIAAIARVWDFVIPR